MSDRPPLRRPPPARRAVQPAIADRSGEKLRVLDMLTRRMRCYWRQCYAAMRGAAIGRATFRRPPRADCRGNATANAAGFELPAHRHTRVELPGRLLQREVDVQVLPRVLAVDVLLVSDHPRPHDRVLDPVH